MKGGVYATEKVFTQDQIPLLGVFKHMWEHFWLTWEGIIAGIWWWRPGTPRVQCCPGSLWTLEVVLKMRITLARSAAVLPRRMGHRDLELRMKCTRSSPWVKQRFCCLQSGKWPAPGRASLIKASKVRHANHSPAWKAKFFYHRFKAVRNQDPFFNDAFWWLSVLKEGGLHLCDIRFKVVFLHSVLIWTALYFYMYTRI